MPKAGTSTTYTIDWLRSTKLLRKCEIHKFYWYILLILTDRIYVYTDRKYQLDSQ